MNYNKVIKDLKERNNKLQEQYRLRDIRCIHLEYENEMLKSDFEAQHELTKKYAKENKELKNQQKEFIEYLEEEINKWHYNYDSYNFEYEMAEPPAEELLENALSRFKEIIGNNEQN